MSDKIVIHRLYGEGIVKNISNGFITVDFPNGKEMTLIYPDAFESVLTAKDEELNKFVKMSVNNKKAENKLLMKKGLNRRILENKRTIPRWGSEYKSRQTDKKLPPKNIKVESYFDKSVKSPVKKPLTKNNVNFKRYDGTNGFGVICNSTFEDEKNSGITIIPKVDLQGKKQFYLDISQQVKIGDVLFHILNNKVAAISVVSENVKSDETDYIINSQYIPVIGKVTLDDLGQVTEAIEKYNKDMNKGIVPFDFNVCKNLTEKVNSVCPYINSIEGVNLFLK
jgi:hypothetical protein